ncbi:MAG: DUF3313 family protein [Gemmatimonadota bacterium]|nr:MAG: DUF3313 family protein [Gemmatimonadota bacterium]
MKSALNAVTIAAILVGLAGCATTPPPTVQMGPDAEVTVDGLHRVDNSVMALAWVKPDLNLQGYTKVMIDEVTVAYQKDPGSRRRDPYGTEQNFALTPSQMTNLKSWFREAVVTALTKDDGYEIVDSPGPDVLHINADLIDLVVRVPTEGGLGRERTYTRSYGEVTLILELRDSESEEILARVADRRDPTRNTDTRLAEVTPTFVRSDTRRLFEYWADLLRQRVDEIRQVDQP